MSDYGDTPPPPPPPPPLPPPPSYGAPGAPGTPPPNYLVWAILTTIFCCLPLGIPSIVFSTQVNSKWALGDVAGAQDASAKAKRFAIWAVVAGLIVAVLYGIAIAVGIANINLNTSTNSSGF
jgi:predicted secreted protein